MAYTNTNDARASLRKIVEVVKRYPSNVHEYMVSDNDLNKIERIFNDYDQLLKHAQEMDAEIARNRKIIDYIIER